MWRLTTNKGRSTQNVTISQYLGLDVDVYQTIGLPGSSLWLSLKAFNFFLQASGVAELTVVQSGLGEAKGSGNISIVVLNAECCLEC